MLLDYLENLASAEEKYKGKLIEVTGTLGSVDTKSITMASDEHSDMIVKCYIKYDGEHDYNVSYVSKEFIITFKGVVIGKIDNIILINGCEILDYEVDLTWFTFAN